MNDTEIMIESLRKQLQDALKKVSALEQENALLNDDLRRLKRASKGSQKRHVL